MRVIVCVDENNGMLFNNRRQSKDCVLLEKILQMVGKQRLLMNEYSAKLFSEDIGIVVSEDFLSIAKEGDFCFIENEDVPKDNVEAYYVFNWNRRYPADRWFEFDELNFHLTSEEEFVGNSHEKITLKIYERCH